jgi:hypothetical protein
MNETSRSPKSSRCARRVTPTALHLPRRDPCTPRRQHADREHPLEQRHLLSGGLVVEARPGGEAAVGEDVCGLGGEQVQRAGGAPRAAGCR